MAKLRCPWCGQEVPKITLADLEAFFQAGDVWREHKPDRCPYCDEVITRRGSWGVFVILLGVVALASLLTFPLGHRPMSVPQVCMTVAGSLLLIVGGVCLSHLPYQRGKGPQYPITGGMVQMERLSKKRLFSQWSQGMVQPVFFVDEKGQPVSEGVCAIFTELHRKNGNSYTARMELVPYHALCDFPGIGGHFFLFIEGQKAACGQIVANLPESSVDS